MTKASEWAVRRGNINSLLPEFRIFHGFFQVQNKAVLMHKPVKMLTTLLGVDEPA